MDPRIDLIVQWGNAKKDINRLTDKTGIRLVDYLKVLQ